MSEHFASVAEKAVSHDVGAAPSSAYGAASTGTTKKPLPAQNPALRMMGLPRFHLPSRNWMIFLGITGSFTGAWLYDRWQTRKVRDKWCKLVSPIADEALDTHTLPRKLTIYLSAPPGDGLRSAREHFVNYVKPVLVSAAIDWDVVEGRKEGDVRFKTAERIRQQRRFAGEGTPVESDDNTVAQVRKDHGFAAYPGVAGDLVLGRHTWKEYIRGLHEGWLGRASPPPDPIAEIETAIVDTTSPSASTDESTSSAEPQGNAEPDEAEKPTSEEKKKEDSPKPRQPPPYITPDHYSEALTSKILPAQLDPTAPVSCPHILGFRNTPIRLYRFLTRRKLADEIGQQTACAILGQSRAFGSVAIDDQIAPSGTITSPEQEEVLKHEERDWWKTARQPRKAHEESVLIEPIILDDRIASRMRQFQLTSEDADRVETLASGS